MHKGALIDEADRSGQNWLVLHRGRRRAAIAAGLLAVAIAAAGTLDLRSASHAMACCAKTHGQCAGVKSADDCCARMTHAAPVVSAVLTGAYPVVALALPARVVLPSSSIDRAGASPSSEFKRPHDPPHLHAPALLI